MTTYFDYILGLKNELNKNKIKQKDLAKLTGLSLATISNTLNCKTTSIEVINKIEKAIKEL